MYNSQVIEVKGIRALTTKQIAEAYETDVSTIQYNFRYNKSKYQLGKHYIEISGEELKEMKRTSEIHSSLKQVKHLYLWTEKGALLHAKSLNTDKAWEVYEYLVDFYFRGKDAMLQSSKIQGSLVVDIPVNEKAQELLTELRQGIAGMESLLNMYNRYSTEENSQKVAYVIQQQGMSIANVSVSIAQLRPHMIEKIL